MSSVVQEDEDIQIPVPELLGALLEKGGSDLHLTAGSPPMVRVHGELELAGLRFERKAGSPAGYVARFAVPDA